MESSSFASLHQRLHCIDKKTRCSESGIFVQGLQGCGKTTISLLLAGIPLVCEKFIDQDILLLAQEQDGVHIADGSLPPCRYPNLFKMGEDVIYDCPTFEKKDQLSRAWFNYRLLSRVQRSKFVLVLTEADLTSTRASLFKKTVKHFLKTFNFTFQQSETRVSEGIKEVDLRLNQTIEESSILSSQQCKRIFSLKDIAQKTMIVINKCSSSLTIETIEKLIKHKCLQEKSTTIVTEFLQFMLKQNRICQVKRAIHLQPIPTTENVKTKLKQIPYLDKEISKNDQQYLESFNFDINVENYKQFFASCASDFQSICKIVDLAFNQDIISNIHIQDYEHKFFLQWHNLIQQIGQNPSPVFNLKMPAKLPYFGSLKLISAVSNLFNNADKDEITFASFFNLFFETIKLISLMLPTSEQNFTIIDQLAFIIDRRKDELLMMQKLHIMIFSDFHTSFGTKIHSIDFRKIEEIFVSNYKVEKGKGQSYYEQAITMLLKYKQSNKQILKKLSECYFEMGRIQQQSIYEWSKAIEDYLQAQSYYEQYSAVIDFSDPQSIHYQVASRLAKLCLFLELPGYAADFYLILDNTQKIQQSYSLLAKAGSPYTSYLMLGDYLITVLLFEEATDAYMRAFSSVCGQQLKYEALQKIVKMHANKTNLINAFNDRVSKKIFYNALPSDFNKQNFLEDARKQEQKLKENFCI